jgi:hypothetical protein
MKALHLRLLRKGEKLSETKKTLQKLREEFLKFERTMEELHLLKQVAQDLRNFREMIKLKRYD